MKHPLVVIFGYSEAAMFLRGSRAPNVKAILSIHGQREFGVEADVEPRLDLTFDDVEIADAADPLAMLRVSTHRRWANENGLNEVPPTESDAAAIIAFAEQVRDVDGLLLCHCTSGIQRPAAALICLAVWRGPGTEKECVAEVLRLRCGTVPHIGLLGLVDKQLGRGGSLADAVRQVRIDA